MQLKKFFFFLIVVALTLSSRAATASELDITATYKGSVKTTAGQFTNTTQGSGTCSEHPEYCPDGYFGLLFPWAGNNGGSMGSKKVVPGSADPRDGFYLSFDASPHQLTVTNSEGKSHSLRLKIDAIGWGYAPSLGNAWYPQGSNCTNIAVPYGNHFLYGMWGAKSDTHTVCFMSAPKEMSVSKIDITFVNMRYTLIMDKPTDWEPGTYKGNYQYTIGAGKDLDFGNNFQGSADDVTLSFTLTVTPDMYVKFWTARGSVVNADLQPPGGWLDWNGQMPPHLSKEITFDFGSTAPVKMHLVCGHTVGKSCGIVDQQGGNALGVDTFLSANHLIDDTGKQALRSPLSTDDHVFTPDTPGGTGVQPARLLFKTQDGITQKMQRGHQYNGLVTVVFDSDVTP